MIQKLFTLQQMVVINVFWLFFLKTKNFLSSGEIPGVGIYDLRCRKGSAAVQEKNNRFTFEWTKTLS